MMEQNQSKRVINNWKLFRRIKWVDVMPALLGATIRKSFITCSRHKYCCPTMFFDGVQQAPVRTRNISGGKGTRV